MTILNEINLVVDVLRNLSERGIKCNLLVGAGCSVSAGIPTAGGIIEEIKQKFPSAYTMVKDKSYANCMNALSPDERIDLIKNLVNNAKLNITHIMIAQLLKGGYIHRILTPNFDNLLIRACSIMNEYPPVYDLASYDEFKPEHIPEKCIFYLHGQFTGFKLMNTNEEVNQQAEKLSTLFQRLNERSVWIIIGYSGLNDALFKLLSKESVFANRLFWIGHKDQEPHKELKNSILQKDKYGFYINGYDSDGFFLDLVKKLGEYPPTFLLRPFSYIKNIMEQIVPYQPTRDCDLNKPTNEIVQSAIDKYESDPVFMAQCYYNAGLYDAVINLEKDLIAKGSGRLVSDACFGKAVEVAVEAERWYSIDLYNQAISLYNKSNDLDEYHGCYNNSGLCYVEIAKLDRLNMEESIKESIRRYLLAIENGDTKYAFNNFLDAIQLLLESKMKNKKIISDIRKIHEMANNSRTQKDYINYIEAVLNNLEKIEYNRNELEKHLNKFLKYVTEKIKQIA